MVVFDLDYTLLRPSDQFEAPGYVRTGARFGLELDAARWPQAERAAYAAAAARREQTGLIHDDGLLPVIAHAIIEGLGGGPADAVELTAGAIIAAWSRAENFGLYDDVLPCLEALRAAGLRMALLSNALGHGVEEIVAHFALDDYMAAARVQRSRPAPSSRRRACSRRCSRCSASRPPTRDGRRQRRGRREGRRRVRLPGDPARPRRAPPGAHLPRIESLAELPAALGLCRRSAASSHPGGLGAVSKEYLTPCLLPFTVRDVKHF